MANGHARQQKTAFDLWLRRDLSRTYDDAVHEPLTDELERLLASVPERASQN